MMKKSFIFTAIILILLFSLSIVTTKACAQETGNVDATEVQNNNLVTDLISASSQSGEKISTEKKDEQKNNDFKVRLKLRNRFESRINFDLKSTTDDNSAYIDQRYQLFMNYKVGSIPFFNEVRYVRPDVNTPKSVELQQFYGDFGKNTVTRAGRQMMLLGSGRLVSERDWGNKGNVFDGFRLMHKDKKFQANLLALKYEPFHKPTAGQEYFYGLFTTYKPLTKTDLDIYFLNKYQQKAAFDGGLNLTRALGMRYLGKFDGLNLEAEGIHEWGFNSVRPMSANGFASVLQYQFQKSPYKPILRVNYQIYSGDANPTDKYYGTFDHLYGRNHNALGAMDLIGPRNSKDLGIWGIIFPVKNMDLSLTAAFHKFNLVQSKDCWYSGNGSVFLKDPTGAWGTDVGKEFDTEARYISKYFDFRTGYSRFWPGNCAKILYKGKTAPADWYFFLLDLKFEQ
jgi:hypothetical protein